MADGSDDAAREAAVVARAFERGRAEFMGLELLVASGALVPRAETALLGHAALKILSGTAGSEPRVVDMCCGVGNLACAIAHHAPATRVWACDIADTCVDIAKRNVALHRLESRVSVHQGDLFGALEGLGLEGTIDVVVCNAPYISESRLGKDRAHLLAHEPREAFSAGAWGLDFHLRTIRSAPAFLKPEGALMLEIGVGQDRQVAALFRRANAFSDVTTVADDEGRARVVYATRRA